MIDAWYQKKKRAATIYSQVFLLCASINQVRLFNYELLRTSLLEQKSSALSPLITDYQLDLYHCCVSGQNSTALIPGCHCFNINKLYQVNQHLYMI